MPDTDPASRRSGEAETPAAAQAGTPLESTETRPAEPHPIDEFLAETAPPPHHQSDTGGDANEPTPAIRLVPLALVAKRRLNVFHITDESGAKQPALTRSQRVGLCVAGLTAYADGLLPETRLPQAILDDLKTICSEPRKQAIEAALKFQQALDARIAKSGTASDPTDDAEASRAAEQADQAPAKEVRVPTGASGTSPPTDDDIRADLFEDHFFRGLAIELAHNHVILVPLAHSEQERVLQFTYEEYIDHPGLAWNEVSLRAKRFLLGTLNGIGWRAHRLFLATPGIADGMSYHLEVEVPAPLQLLDPELVVYSEDASKVLDCTRGSYTRAHLLTDSAPHASSSQFQAGLLLRESTIIRSGWYVSLFSSLVLTVAGLRLKRFTHSDPVPLLLVVPGLVSVYLGAQSELGLVNRLAYSLRFLAVMPAACAFAGAALIVGASGDDATGTLWWLVSGAAWLCWLVFSVAKRQARWRRRSDEDDV